MDETERVVQATREHIEKWRKQYMTEEQEEVSVEGTPDGYDILAPTQSSILACARIVHVAVEALNRAYNETTLPWEVVRDSIITGIHRHLENPGESPDANHNAWMEYKAKEGWVYGTVKDSTAKTHPCMVPYDALPTVQKSKDLIFMAIVDEFFGVEKPKATEPEPVAEEKVE